MTVHERIYRSLLVVYPPQHRREYGEPMTQLMRDRLRDEGGGARTVLVWAHVGTDLARTALSERTETTMQWFKTGWWLVAALLIAPIFALLGIGDLMEEASGPLYGRIFAATVGVTAAVVIVTGLIVRRRNKVLGSAMIGVGVLPGTFLIMMFWFPPVALFGLLCAAVAITALIDADRNRRVAELPS